MYSVSLYLEKDVHESAAPTIIMPSDPTFTLEDGLLTIDFSGVSQFCEQNFESLLKQYDSHLGPVTLYLYMNDNFPIKAMERLNAWSLGRNIETLQINGALEIKTAMPGQLFAYMRRLLNKVTPTLKVLSFSSIHFNSLQSQMLLSAVRKMTLLKCSFSNLEVTVLNTLLEAISSNKKILWHSLHFMVSDITPNDDTIRHLQTIFIRHQPIEIGCVNTHLTVDQLEKILCSINLMESEIDYLGLGGDQCDQAFLHALNNGLSDTVEINTLDLSDSQGIVSGCESIIGQLWDKNILYMDLYGCPIRALTNCGSP